MLRTRRRLTRALGLRNARMNRLDIYASGSRIATHALLGFLICLAGALFFPSHDAAPYLALFVSVFIAVGVFLLINSLKFASKRKEPLVTLMHEYLSVDLPPHPTRIPYARIKSVEFNEGRRRGITVRYYAAAKLKMLTFDLSWTDTKEHELFCFICERIPEDCQPRIAGQLLLCTPTLLA